MHDPFAPSGDASLALVDELMAAAAVPGRA
jgi:hypothetical protein